MMDLDSFSKAKDMIFPRDILVGHDTLPQVSRMCDDFNFRKVGMIITGDATYKSAGKAVEEYMKEGLKHDPTTTKAIVVQLFPEDLTAHEAMEFAKNHFLSSHKADE